MDSWTPDKFNRRRYVAEGKALDEAKRIELIVKVDGKQLVHMTAREPGMLAFVSKPADQGFEIEVVEANGARYNDIATVDNPPEPVADWQLEALGMPRRG